MSRWGVEEDLARFYRRLTSEPAAPRQWLREGTLRPVVVLLLALIPFALAGPVRRLTSLEMLPALILSAYLVLLASLPLWPALGARRPGGRLHFLLGFLAVLLVGGFGCYVLYTRYFGGLTNFRGTDGSFHVFYYHEFIRTDPLIYQGFVSTYSAFYFAQRILGCNVFWAFVVVFYAEVAIVSALPMLIVAALLWPLRKTARLSYALGMLLAPAAAGLLLYYVVLPEQHMYQTDGFFPQLFGLLPLFALWVIDALVEAAPLRVLFLLLTLVLFRFTYALNLGDALVAVAALVALELRDRRLHPRFRVALGVLAVLLALVARHVYVELWPLQKNVGHFLAYDVRLLLRGHTLGLVVLALMIVGTLGSDPPLADRGFARAARFPLLFGAVSAGMLALFILDNGDQRYYFYKYPFAPLVLVTAACSALLPAALAHLAAGWRAQRRRARNALLAAVAIFAMYGATSRWHRAILPHWQGYTERAWGKPPFNLNEDNLPLADLGAWRRIESVLATTHKRFGGYMISQFGMMLFTNAAFDLPNFGWSLWFGGGFKADKPGTCFFWDEGTSRDWLVWESGFVRYNRLLRDRLQWNREKQCQTYHAHWDPDGPPRILCHLCY